AGQRREHAGRVGGRQRGRKDQGPRVMAEIVDDVLGSCRKAADRGQRLRERAYDQIDFVDQIEVCCRAVAVRAENTDRVRVVDGERRAVLLADLEQPGDVG